MKKGFVQRNIQNRMEYEAKIKIKYKQQSATPTDGGNILVVSVRVLVQQKRKKLLYNTL